MSDSKEFAIDLAGDEHALRDRMAAAVNLIIEANGVDGGHHKEWYLDQVLRALVGIEQYKKFVEWYGKQGDEYDGETYFSEWEAGIAP